MRQKWSDLCFVHWDVDPEMIQARLPPGLEVDTLDGHAFVSFVPFNLEEIRTLRFPWLPRLRFLEWNLRTYVRHKGKGRGIWFFSLDAASAFAVTSARAWYKLPYHYGQMSVSVSDGTRSYTCDRRWPGPASDPSRFDARPIGDPKPAESGSLEFWLVERYQLYSCANGRLYSGRVVHPPYDLCSLEVQTLELGILRAEQFTGLGNHLELAQYSPGVSVEVWPLVPCD